MAKSTTILIATETLIGGIAGKDDKPPVPFQLDADEELTKEAQKALGLSNDDVAQLTALGKFTEVKARLAASASEDPVVTALEKKLETATSALAAMTTRAETAEAAKAELQKQIDDAAAAAAKSKSGASS